MDYITELLKHSNYYEPGGVLVNDPKPMPGQKEPRCLYLFDDGIPVEYSVVMPVHDQEDIIVDNLLSVLLMTTGAFELIVICDGCTDGTTPRVMRFLENNRAAGLHKVILISQPSSIFETSSDNMGFRLSSGKYVVEVQSDMKMMTYGYNYLLSVPTRVYDDVIAVSARCCHSFPGVPFVGKGRLDAFVDRPLHIEYDEMNKFYVCDTVNRGPLLLVRDKLKELGYLDEANFVLGNDDHDLMVRARASKGWICGYVPIEFMSPLRWGTTRKVRSAMDSEFLDLRRKRSNGGFLKNAHKYAGPNFVTEMALFNQRGAGKLLAAKGSSESVTVVTGASSNHFFSMCQCVDSVLRNSCKARVVAYDLRLTDSERTTFKSLFPTVELRRFCYEYYPAFFDIEVEAGQYAWKPSILREVVSEFGGVVIWADAGNIVDDLESLVDAVRCHNIYTPLSCGGIIDWTHKGTLEYMNVKDSELQLRCRNGALVGLDASVPYAKAFADEWASYSSIEDCIAPRGSDRSNHRQDQAVLTILFYRYLTSYGFHDLKEYAGFTVHNDTPRMPAHILGPR